MTAGNHAVSGYEPVQVPGRAAAGRAETAMFRRKSGQPSRRAVLHVQATGDPAAPEDLGAWCTERAFHFYLAGLRLPGQAPVGARPAARYLAAAFADLDAACAHLRDADGIASVIVSAQGRGAIAAAMWRDARPDAADALILLAPHLPAGASLSLTIDCPILVLAEPAAAPGRLLPTFAARGWPVRRRAAQAADLTPAARKGPAAPADRAGLQLGSHVTWLRLPAPEAGDTAAGGAARRQFYDELGRWLGAYMYGHVPDQLL